MLAACGTPPAPTAPAAEPVLPDVPFALLDRDQRAQFMKERVVPAMAPLFRAHDPARFADFGCVTCHGDDPTYAMPNPALPGLHADRTQHDPRAVAWMTDTIRPAMARLLARDIDCLGCHVRQLR